MAKYILLVLFGFIYCNSQAQVIDDDNGKTYFYYDSLTHKKVKEIYRKENWYSYTELIFGLPMEDYDSYIGGIEKSLSNGFFFL